MTTSRRDDSRFAAAIAAVLCAAGALSSACGDAREGFNEQRPNQSGFDDVDGGLLDVTAAHCISQEVVQGEKVPLAIAVLLDRSSSMDGAMWTSATSAIRAFADRSEVVGMKMGLQFFPPLGGADQCNPSSYSDLAVPIDVLPDNVLLIQQRLASTKPSGGTPMSAGLDGTIKGMSKWLASAEPHAAAVILVTDGDPMGCGSVDVVAGIAASGAAATPSVRTFAVGMQGATFSNLDKIAAAGGGSPRTFDVGGGPGAQQALLDALEAIRRSALDCQYVLPIPRAEHGVVDPSSIDIKFTPGRNDHEVTIRLVANEAACNATAGGFYYDDPERPTRIILCPASCHDVRAVTADAKLDILLGCITRPR